MSDSGQQDRTQRMSIADIKKLRWVYGTLGLSNKKSINFRKWQKL